MNRCPMCNQAIEDQKINRDEIRKVVTVYKMVTGYDKDDKSWDRMFFARYMKSAKKMIEFMGSWEWAADCIQDIYEKFSSLGFTVTMETIEKHCGDWKKDKLEQEGRRGVLSHKSA